MERPEHEEPREDASAADDESPEEFAEELENDPAYNPPND